MMAKEKEIMPWERQEDETPKQFEAFKVYRNMGEERSLSKVSKQLSKSTALMARWSRSNNWVDRCVAWDNEQDRLLAIEQRKEIKKMRKRHADVASAMIATAVKGLKQIQEHMEDVKPQDVARLVDVASKLERISRGDTSEVIEQRQGESVNAVQIYIPDNGRSREDDSFDDLEV